MAAYVTSTGSIEIGNFTFDKRGVTLVEGTSTILHLYAVDAVARDDDSTLVYYVFAHPVTSGVTPFMRARPARLQELLVPLPCAFVRKYAGCLRVLSAEELTSLVADEMHEITASERSEMTPEAGVDVCDDDGACSSTLPSDPPSEVADYSDSDLQRDHEVSPVDHFEED
jgi:hypothetical protein